VAGLGGSSLSPLGGIAPKGRQSDAIYYAPDRDLVVLGTAGTGKTTMAVLRARFLASPIGTNGGPVLLVTFNNALVRYLRHLVPATLGDVTVETYSKFARGYLHSVGEMPPWGGIANGAQLTALVAGAVMKVRADYAPGSRFFDRDRGFFVDELAWISGMGISSEEEYLAAERVGRKIGLDEAHRRAVWQIREAYIAARADNGFVYDWDDIATAVRRNLEVDPRPRMYRHVVIDEGQDLSPEAIRSLKGAVQPGGTVSFFGDYHQQIYGQGLSFRRCGLEVQAVDRFQDNYRNTAEIARVAIAMSTMPHMAADPQDLVEPVEPKAAGARPSLVNCREAAGEIRLVQRIAKDQAAVGTVAILARTWPLAKAAAAGLDARPLKEDNDIDWDPSPGIHYGTYHSAKGLEFDVVLMPFCSADRIPHAEVLSSYGEDDANAREGRLLYVAVTRARAELTVTYSGTPTTLLPTNPGLWNELSL
jgi:superfamily I DNA/RNA helicase